MQLTNQFKYYKILFRKAHNTQAIIIFYQNKELLII